MNFFKEILNGYWIFLQRVGFLDDRRRAYFFISVPFVVWFTGYYKLLSVLGDTKEVISYLFIDFAQTVIITRAFIFIFKGDKFLNLFSDMKKWNDELLLENDAKTIKNLRDFTRNWGRCSKYLFRSWGICMIYSSLSEIFTIRFSIDMSLPGIDLYESPYYQIVCTLQAIWLIPFNFLTYLAYLCVMWTSISFGILLMKDIQYKLENMPKSDEMEALKCIKTCLRRHALIIKFREDLEALFSLGNFLDVSYFCITPCIIFVYINLEYDLTILIRDAQLVILISISTFTTFWLANNFYIEGLNISQAAYNCYWTDQGTEFRRYIIVLIAISQRSLELTVGGIKPLNMEFFMSIVRATYSFFTILQGTVN